MYVDADGVGCGRRGALLSPGWLGLSGCGWCWKWTARRVAVAWLVGFERMRWCWGGRRGVFFVAWLRIFLFFACGGVGVTCIVEYWNVV